MKRNNKNEPKIIRVIGPDGQSMSRCSKDKAYRLVSTNRAAWSAYNTITLFKTKADLYEEKQEIIEEAGRICYICGDYIPEDDEATVDHVIPKSTRSPYAYEKENQKCCCKRCNRDKANRTLTSYISHICSHRDEYSYISKTRLKKLRLFAEQHEKKFIMEELLSQSKNRNRRKK